MCWTGDIAALGKKRVRWVGGWMGKRRKRLTTTLCGEKECQQRQYAMRDAKCEGKISRREARLLNTGECERKAKREGRTPRRDVSALGENHIHGTTRKCGISGDRGARNELTAAGAFPTSAYDEPCKNVSSGAKGCR
jgi:hypothetical protein